ncbi:MAG: protein translocase subunit SecD [Ignavibacteriales bacterium]|nr:protein translocase subunit SecD [Ignavibacteriales bacterium]
MKEIRFRLFLIIGAIALSLYLLYPTYQDYQNGNEVTEKLKSIQDSVKKSSPVISNLELKEFIQDKKDSILTSNPDYKSAREKRIKLGLDLQGGMYMVMEVNTAKLLERLAKDPDEQFKQLLNYAESESKLSDENVVSILARKMQEKGIRLSRYFGTIREDDSKIIGRLLEQESDAVTRAIEIIRNRVDQYGVSEPSIQKQGSRRIIIELPGVAREEEAKRLLQGRALLEFKLVKDADFALPIMSRIDEVLAGKVDTSAVKDTAAKSDTTKNLTEEQFKKEHPFFAVARLIDQQGRTADAYVKESDKTLLSSYLERPEVANVLPNNVEFVYEAKPETAEDGSNFYRMYMVNREPELTGGVIVDAQANIDPTTSSPIVSMQMNSEGARDWARITGSNVDKRCAIVLDGVAYSAPVIQGKIPTGNSQISGMPNLEEAKLLEIVLKAGALPAPIDIIEERTIGPSLGQDSVSQGFNSAWIGYAMVALFMLIYYKAAGSIADIGVIATILFILGVLSGFQATLTLPGIAGIVLTMGMAVDANVLIYERIREELATGKTVKAAIDNGFKMSFSAIFDSNITTFITGIILYQFGSGPVQGFALTLMIGIAASMFSALVIVRVLFDYMTSKGIKINVG